MRVAVLGGAGFVGGHVVDRLMKVGHDVVILDSREPKWHASQMYRKVNMLDYEGLVEALSGSQVVMHLAAMSNTQAALNDPIMCTRLNCEGTVKVLEACRTVGVDRFVLAGSTLVSGMFSDDIEMHIDVWEASHPYVASKIYAEMMARIYTRQYGLPTTIFRYGIQYGERMTPGVVVHTFIERAIQGKPLIVDGDGKQWRQYVYVGDIAKAHSMILDRWDESENRTFNLVGREKVSIMDIAEAVAAAIPARIEHGPARDGDIAVRYCSPEWAKDVIGWEAKVGLEDGVRRTAQWYKHHLASGMRRR